MAKSSMMKIKEIWIDEIIRATKYDLAGPEGKAMFKDLKKLNFATLGIIRGTLLRKK